MIHDIHVLVVPSWYRSEKIPLNGSFFQEQALGLSRHVGRVGIIYPNFESVKAFRRESLSMPRGFINHKVGNVNEIHINSIGIPNRNLRLIQWKSAVKRLYSEYVKLYGKPDIIHAQGAYFAGASSIELARQHNIPLVYSEHSSYVLNHDLNQRDINLLRSIIDNSRVSTAVSSHLASVIKKYTNHQIKILPNFIDFELFEALEIEDSEKPFSFIFVGFLNANKRVSLIIDAFCQTFSELDKVELVIVGDGPEFNMLKAMVNEKGRHSQIKLMGEVERHKVPQILSQADCLISASRNETFGVSLVEAHASGLYVIATDSGGTKDIISSHNGVLIDKEGLRLPYSMLNIYENRQIINKSLIRHNSWQRYDSQVVINDLIGLYKIALGDFSGTK